MSETPPGYRGWINSLDTFQKFGDDVEDLYIRSNCVSVFRNISIVSRTLPELHSHHKTNDVNETTENFIEILISNF